MEKYIERRYSMGLATMILGYRRLLQELKHMFHTKPTESCFLIAIITPLLSFIFLKLCLDGLLLLLQGS
jgi:hypothetical protein